MGCIYKIYCKENGKSYIGQYKKETPDKRWKRHLYDAENGSDCAIHQAIRKYGVDSFEVSVLCLCETQEELDCKEDEYIDINKSMINENGYNMIRGGRKRAPNFHHKEEHKKKMSELMSNRIVSDETRAKISQARIGKKNNWSEETRQRVAEKSRLNATGKICSEETREKISNSLKGRPGVVKGQKRTTEQKQRISDAKRGTKSSEETKKILSEVQSQRHKETPIPHKNCLYTEDDIRYMRKNPENLSIDELRDKFKIHRYRLLKIINKELYKNVSD